ncbi:hypothetical protein NLI96_g8487 [Meripilus lineatus]|uniref:Uncharacterized protein n=1 Tax=Meripilus lineatus TaxID=2056292 RepID=A0AAD5UX97_9APHY|nr:hypothetical protein NLI96_g8487 [Physisporinus lineatus]
MEFRVVDFNQVGWEGMVCEVWKFPKPRLAQLLGAEDRGVTLPPDFYESFRIVMPPLPGGDTRAPHSPVVSHGDIDSRRVSTIFWTTHSENLDWNLDEHDRPSLHLLGPTTQSFYVHEQPTHIRDYDVVTGPSEPSLHPEIPLPVWYDETRGLPNLPQETMPLYDNSFLAHKYSNGVFLFGAPSRMGLEKPPALAVFPPIEHLDRLQLHDPPFVGVGDARHVDRSSEGYISYSRDRGVRLHARYYPMIFPQIPEAMLSVEPDQEIWKPESLIGLWYGAYEVYGSEVLFLDWDAITNEVKAWKVTGDINVPRGAVSWSFQTSARVDLDDHAWEVFSQLGHISRDVRAYRGIGVVGGRGYMFVMSIFYMLLLH